MPIDIDIAHVARLARLSLPESDMDTYQGQLEVILDHASRVQALDVGDLEPTSHPLGVVASFREDEVRPSLDRDEVLAQAPDHRDGSFVVPPAMESQ